MLSDYIQAALHKATYKLLEERTFYGEIPELRGVWVNAETREACREDLKASLEGWI